MTEEQRKIKYRELCEQGKITGLFMQPWWLDAAGEWDVSFAMRNERIIGAMPFAIKRKWGIKHLGMPGQAHHLTLWMDKPPDITPHKWLTREKQIIWSMIDHLPPHGFFSMVFTGDSFDNWLPFHWKGFRQEMRYTFMINSTDDIDAGLNRNMRRNLRENERITIRSGITTKAFYDHASKTYARQKMKMPYKFDAFEKMDDAVMRHHAGVKLAAFLNDQKLLSVAYLMWDKDSAYYLLAGDDEPGRETGAGLILCREAMRIAFEDQKVKQFDFCGSMIEPVTEIRRQFGAKSVPLLKIYKANYRWLDVLYRLKR